MQRNESLYKPEKPWDVVGWFKYFQAWGRVAVSEGVRRDAEIVDPGKRLVPGSFLDIGRGTTLGQIQNAIRANKVLVIRPNMTIHDLEDVADLIHFEVGRQVKEPGDYALIRLKTNNPAVFGIRHDSLGRIDAEPVIERGYEAIVVANYCLQYASMLGLSRHEGWNIAKRVQRGADKHIETALRENLVADYGYRVHQLVGGREDGYISQITLADMTNWQIFVQTMSVLGRLRVLTIGTQLVGVGPIRGKMIADMELSVARSVHLHEQFTVSLGYLNVLAGTVFRYMREHSDQLSPEMFDELVDVVGLGFRLDPRGVNWVDGKRNLQTFLYEIGRRHGQELPRRIVGQLKKTGEDQFNILGKL